MCSREFLAGAFSLARMNPGLTFSVLQAKQSSDRRQQFLSRDRFGEVTICGFESTDAIFRFGECGRDVKNGYMRSTRIGFQTAAYFETIHIGQANIESDEIGTFVSKLEGLCTGARLDDLISGSLQGP